MPEPNGGELFFDAAVKVSPINQTSKSPSFSAWLTARLGSSRAEL
ncbi:hypothetical protein [Deinococcus marmoris]|nr:hypothetical protein [Deinococcus marmoris]